MMNLKFDAKLIDETFRDRYKHWELEICDFKEISEGKFKLSDKGWNIRCIIGDEYIQFYATHRMTSDTHYRIYTDGTIKKLDAAREAYSWNPEVDGDREIKQQEYFEYNRKIGEMLKELGLMD